jgi:hypothetical protein
MGSGRIDYMAYPRLFAESGELLNTVAGKRSSIPAILREHRQPESDRSQRLSPTLARALARGRRTQEWRAWPWSGPSERSAILVVLVVVLALVAGFAAGRVTSNSGSVTVVLPSEAGPAASPSGVGAIGSASTQPNASEMPTTTTTVPPRHHGPTAQPQRRSRGAG